MTEMYMNSKEEDEFFLIYGSRKRKKEIEVRRAAAQQTQKQGEATESPSTQRRWGANPHLLWLVPTIIAIAGLAVLAMQLDAYPFWTR